MANEFVAKNGLISQNNSVVTGSLIVTNGITGSLQGNANTSTTASFALAATSASYALQTTSSSFTTTSSYASNADLLDGLNSTAFAQLALVNRFTTNQIITGSLTATGDIITQGNIIAQQYIVSSSVSYFTESFSSGSTKFELPINAV